MEPPQRLQEELRKNGLSDMQFFLLKHGESRLIEIKEADTKEEEQADEDHEHHHEHAEADHEHHGHHEHQEQEADQGLIDYLVDKMAGGDEQQEE